MADKLTWAQAVAHMGGDEARLQQYLKGDTSSVHPTFTVNLPIADGMMRSRITTIYTAASYDALTDSTIPSYLQFYLFCLMLGAATAHDDGRPDTINAYAGIAAGWLDDVASGKAKIPELTEIGSGETSGRNIRVSGPDELTFDRDNDSQNFNARDGAI